MYRKHNAKVSKVLTVLLSLALMIGVVAGTASAEGENLTLTVNAPGTMTEEAQADFEAAQVVLDVYQVAGAEKDPNYDTYNYTLMAPYTGLALTEEMDNDAWKAVSLEAAALAKDQGSPIVEGAAVGDPISGSDDSEFVPGLYLVIPRGANETDYWTTVETEDGAEEIASMALSPVYEYDFSPILISLPNKTDENGDGEVKTSVEDGDWLTDVTATLKYTQKERFGDLYIYKTIEAFEGSQATFVFRVTAVDAKGNTVYENIATVQMGQSGTEFAYLDKIPAGTTVTVVEEYTGARFQPVGSDTQTVESLSAESGANAVEFENEPNGKDVLGYGIENHFVYEDDGWQGPFQDAAPEIPEEAVKEAE